MNGVSVARRTRVKPAVVRISRRRFSPAWAPRAVPTSWESEFGVQTSVFYRAADEKVYDLLDAGRAVVMRQLESQQSMLRELDES